MSTGEVHGDFMPKPVTTLHTYLGYIRTEQSARSIGDIIRARSYRISRQVSSFMILGCLILSILQFASRPDIRALE